MDKATTFKYHRKLWNWVLKHPFKEKSEWFKSYWKGKKRIKNNCFFCNYFFDEKNRICNSECPMFVCDESESLYRQYIEAFDKDDFKEVIKVVEKIKDLGYLRKRRN